MHSTQLILAYDTSTICSSRNRCRETCLAEHTRCTERLAKCGLELETTCAECRCWIVGYTTYVLSAFKPIITTTNECSFIDQLADPSSRAVGSYLFARISADGSDSRFDNIRNSPPKFLGAFFAQATWVSLCLMPVLAINALPASVFASLPAAVGITDIIGLLLYVGGLSFEVAADRQKNAWVQEKKEKKHEEDFLTRGLWSKSRHPNYFGEATLWTGIASTAAGVLMTNVGQVGMGLAGWGLMGKGIALAACGASPAFVSFLLLKVSGVPLSETKYDKRYGDREDYKKWKEETPMFIPKL